MTKFNNKVVTNSYFRFQNLLFLYPSSLIPVIFPNNKREEGRKREAILGALTSLDMYANVNKTCPFWASTPLQYTINFTNQTKS